MAAFLQLVPVVPTVGFAPAAFTGGFSPLGEDATLRCGGFNPMLSGGLNPRNSLAGMAPMGGMDPTTALLEQLVGLLSCLMANEMGGSAGGLSSGMTGDAGSGASVGAGGSGPVSSGGASSVGGTTGGASLDGASGVQGSSQVGGADLSKAVNLAQQAAQNEQKYHNYSYTQAAGARTNNGKDPLSSGSNTFDCSGFVGAIYKAAGLPAPYGSNGYTGTSFDIPKNGNANMRPVSEQNAVPGDVVVFPDHIALYIGNGQCINMGQQGDPKQVSVASEAAYHNRGVQGFYHPVK